jgi:arylsulfatase
MGETFVEFPPIQKPASFNLEAVKEQIRSAIQSKQVQ